MHPIDWLRRRDSDLVALRRAARAAVVMPAMFAIGDKVIGDPTLATFAAFGSFAMLLLADFGGSLLQRFQAQLLLGVVGTVLVALGSLAGRAAWLAALTMTAVAGCVLFAGVISSVLAGASTSLLLSFILPVATPGPVSSLPARLEGWGLAAGAALIAVVVLWPAPPRHPLRHPVIEACRRLAERMRAEAAFVRGDEDRSVDDVEAAQQRARDAVTALQRGFYGTPYRPTGLTSAARAIVRLVDELGWLARVLDASSLAHLAAIRGRVHPEICAVKGAAADVIDGGADLLETPAGASSRLAEDSARLRRAADELEEHAARSLPSVAERSEPAGHTQRLVSALEPGFRAQELSYAVGLVANNITVAAAADRRTWWEQMLGRQPDGAGSALDSARARAAGHLSRHAVWLHNSVRGAVALGLAVLVADLTGVQHSFWVVLGTLSVLRSNALSTGQNLLRALGGTVLGFVVGGLLVWAIGANPSVLWILLPVAIVVAGIAPAVISFFAGQAAFTVTLVILFNIAAPAGWRIGLVRIEDIAIGGGVSLAVGLLFWPRGAGSELAVALSDAYASCAAYLRGALAFGLYCCDPTGSTPVPPAPPSVQAAASARRLDDAFRTFLTERGAKQLPLAGVSTLVGGVAGLRLAADAILDLWSDGYAPSADRSAARRELVGSAESIAGWYDALAAALAGHGDVPVALPAEPGAAQRLVDAVRDDLDADGAGTSTGVRVVWTGDHLDAARRLQDELVGPAGLVVDRLRQSAGGRGAALRHVFSPAAVRPVRSAEA
ncbi:MAG TPA: FUSC family protein [Mycobacteriales bacterium]|nr:FUSC family protein [Mycobacteriales bacterium]